MQCGAVRSGESFSCVVERRAGGLGGQGQGGAGLAGGHWHYPPNTGGAGEGAGSVLPLPAHSSWGRLSGHIMSQGRHLVFPPTLYDSNLFSMFFFPPIPLMLSLEDISRFILPLQSEDQVKLEEFKLDLSN